MWMRATSRFPRLALALVPGESGVGPSVKGGVFDRADRFPHPGQRPGPGGRADALAPVGRLHVPGPGGLRPRPGRSRRLERLPLRDGPPRRRRARQPASGSRPRQPGRRAERLGLRGPHRFGGATLAANLPPALRIFADLLPPPHLPDDQLEAARQLMIQEWRAVEDEPAEKLMVELRRRHYPDPWGRPAHGELKALESIDADDIRRISNAAIGPRGRSSPWPAGSIGTGSRGRSASYSATGGTRRGRASPSSRPPAATPRLPYESTRRRSASPIPACPIATPTISRRGARWAC